ncbi:MAG: SnoaL-like domain-containing protein [Proteobacteria bacterium]|nr:SnoaL-like domain-containing protein [Pseudomonadota bacterium]
MAIFERLHQALSARDAKAYVNLLDDDYRFIRHRYGAALNKSEMEALLCSMMDAETFRWPQDARCIYENDEILVEHHVADFADAGTEAVLAVHLIKDGKIIRTETGATTIDA